MSLRRRLLLALLATVVTALTIAGGLTYVLVSRSQLAQVDDDLARALPPIEEAAAGDEGTRSLEIRDVAPGFYAELRDESGATLLVVPLRDRDGDLLTIEGIDVQSPPPDADDDTAAYSTVTIEDDEVMRIRTTRRDDGSLLVIGRSLEELLHTRRQLLTVLVLTGLGAAAAAAAIGGWLVRIGLRPLRDVERAAAAIGDDDLSRRVPGDDSDTEVGQLARSINHMLQRLDDAFAQREEDLSAVQESEARMRRFVADASHELRTPIAATAAYAELFERGARDRPDDLERAMAGIRSETARMAELVEDLLLLARLDEGRPLALGEIDLGEVVTDAVEVARTVDPTRPVQLRLDDGAIVIGDHGRLRQVVDNLLGNVRIHTPPGTACEVRVAVDEPDVVLTVHDDGPGMEATDAARAFDRFHRADTSRTRASGGSGLGLSIVAAIVAAHGGATEIVTSPGAGTTVVIRLPIGDHPTSPRSPRVDTSTVSSTTRTTARPGTPETVANAEEVM
jgi:two-component system OmpR family sensor kinase